MRKAALIMLVLFVALPLARAGALPLAAELDAHAQFERYTSYQVDEATGEWQAYGLAAQQILGAAEQSDIRGYMEGGVCVLYPGVRGSLELSLTEPVLYVCLLRSSPIKADALSIATGGVRYDFAGKAEQIQIGSRSCERFALPLSGDGLALLHSFAKEGGQVRVYGETKVFRTGIAEADRYKSSKLRVEAMSVGAAREFLPLWPEAYALWDLNAAHWAQDRPRMKAVPLREDGYPESLPALDPATQCLDIRKGSAVRAYQRMLKEKGFFAGGLNASYGKAARASTRQAQQYHGLLPTGMADRALMELLHGAAQPSAEPKLPAPSVALTDAVHKANPGTVYTLEGHLSLRLDRAWTARSLSPSHSSGLPNRVYPADRSNRLYIADGEITNLSNTPMQPGLLLQGYVEMDDIRLPCAVHCERDEGRAFGASLLPMGKSRLVVVCEVPQGLQPSSCALHLEIQGAIQKPMLQFGP